MRPMTEKRFLKRLILFANIDSPPLNLKDPRVKAALAEAVALVKSKGIVK